MNHRTFPKILASRKKKKEEEKKKLPGLTIAS